MDWRGKFFSSISPSPPKKNVRIRPCIFGFLDCFRYNWSPDENCWSGLSLDCPFYARFLDAGNFYPLQILCLFCKCRKIRDNPEKVISNVNTVMRSRNCYIKCKFEECVQLKVISIHIFGRRMRISGQAASATLPWSFVRLFSKSHARYFKFCLASRRFEDFQSGGSFKLKKVSLSRRSRLRLIFHVKCFCRPSSFGIGKASVQAITFTYDSAR